MAESRQTYINSSPTNCFKTICDFESYPEWQKTIKKVIVLEKENGRPLIVEYHLDAILKTITYTLRYTYHDKDAKKMILEWDYVGGDLKKIVGSYTFEEIEPNKTLATFWLDVELGLWVPRGILEVFKTKTIEESIQALKLRVESLYNI